MFKVPSIILALLFSIQLSAQSPHGNGLKIDCNVCHTTKDWQVKEKGFDHNTTSFKLTGQHKEVACRACHPTLVFTDAKPDCASCHKDVHQGTVGQDCDRCHNTTSWVVGNITEIHRQSRFPLEGGHAGVDCNQCHKSGSRLRFDPMSTECVSCHLKDYNATTNPSHSAAQFPKDCRMCHDGVDWKNATFDHNTTTSFPLKGGHLGLTCNQCHAQKFAGTSTECVACHRKDFDGTTNPSHVKAGFGTECQTCHNDVFWKPSSFNHDTETSFVLNGGHKGLSCNQCHTQGFAGTSTACVACHLKDYNATTDPAHAAAQFPTDCKMCHNELDWKNATFDHNKTTNFPLRGGHIGLTCNQCHAKGFAGTSTACIDCHMKDFNATTNPNHTAAGFGTNCHNCHREEGWKPSSFNHDTETSFVLNGGHKGLSCNQCHTQGFAGTSTACVACHLKDYNATTDPAHAAAQFPTDCKMCHNELDWKSATFDHNTTTSFPLKGGHIGLTCNRCHAQGFVGTSTACVSCHQNDYNATTNPSHTKAGFSAECQTCHTDVAWKPSSFNHNTATSFALTGAHRSLTCNQCHTVGFKGTSTACVACHLNDYNSTTNPAHATAKFPSTCETCHNTTVWTPSTFNHDSQHFPIYSGKHRGKWTTCSQCHTNAANFGVFSCLTCHEHNKTSTDADHRGVSGYVYNSSNCLACHPRGSS